MSASPIVDLLQEHIAEGRLPGAVLGIADSGGVRELIALGADEGRP